MSELKNTGDVASDLSAAVKRILWENWDPIGVKDMPGAQGEYDGYAPNLCRMIEASAPESEIFIYLWNIETDRMALPGNREHTASIAAKLHALVSNDPERHVSRQQ